MQLVIQELLPDGCYRTMTPVSADTTFGIRGPAEGYIMARSGPVGILDRLRLCRQKGIPHFNNDKWCCSATSHGWQPFKPKFLPVVRTILLRARELR